MCQSRVFIHMALDWLMVKELYHNLKTLLIAQYNKNSPMPPYNPFNLIFILTTKIYVQINQNVLLLFLFLSLYVILYDQRKKKILKLVKIILALDNKILCYIWFD